MEGSIAFPARYWKIHTNRFGEYNKSALVRVIYQSEEFHHPMMLKDENRQI